MGLTVDLLKAGTIKPVLPELAALRIAVFRDWPYLYDGDAAYEERYLAAYAKSPGAVIVAVRDGERLVGAATGAPMGEHDAAFAAPLVAAGIETDRVFYCAESVLLPNYRGQGIGHRFFDLREAHARALGCTVSAFCSVIRPQNHPARPEDYRPLDTFWRARGYAPLRRAIATYDWRDVGDAHETPKPMQVWIKSL